MVRDGKRSPAPPPEPAEGDAGPGQQRRKKRGREGHVKKRALTALGCEVHTNADQNAVTADDYRRLITTDSQAEPNEFTHGGVSSTLTTTTMANQAIQAPPPRILFSGPTALGLNVAMATPASSFAVPSAATMGTLAPEMSLPNKSLFQSKRAVTCEGITSGSSGPVLSFVAKAQRSSSVMLDEMSWDEASGYGHCYHVAVL
ncbi:hypothetical protein THAOC_03585 [Thalassiosira oceanica]|uniref:Uncharacterized protein n=1 Tax=Thalassiosira oceanica TaxID=159749 RepID=K0TC78_THAOC|nr:hypothetical protein THAOC_03585 [Thalassiosira oceanica]|eukprot:EJK74719.1 hypothetical protein THAOC_03585 [Thalassiosira oceanica]